MEKQTQRIDLWTRGGGEEGKGEMCGESNMEIYITISEMNDWWGFAL